MSEDDNTDELIENLRNAMIACNVANALIGCERDLAKANKRITELELESEKLQSKIKTLQVVASFAMCETDQQCFPVCSCGLAEARKAANI